MRNSRKPILAGLDADALRAHLLFNGLPPDFVAAVKTAAPGVDPEQLAGAAFDARTVADSAQKAAAELRSSALSEVRAALSDLQREVRALRQRRARESEAVIGFSRIALLAQYREPGAFPDLAKITAWTSADESRREDLEQRIAILRDLATRLDGRGAPRSWLRDFAEALAPAIVTMTGRRPTITRPTDTSPDKEWRGTFAALLVAAARLFGEDPSPASAEAVVAELAKAAAV